MIKTDGKHYRKKTCRFCEKDMNSDKVGDHCHLTGKYRGSAHNKCDNIVTEQQNVFVPFIFHVFSNYDSHLIFKNLVDKKNRKVKNDIIPKTMGEYNSVTHGCIRFIGSC